MLVLAVVLSLALWSTAASEIVSIQVHNNPRLYVVDRDSLAGVAEASSQEDAKQATFSLVPGLANAACVSLESVAKPGHFLRHQEWRIRIHELEETELFRKDATFRLVAGVAGQTGTSFESYNLPDCYLIRRGAELFLAHRDTMFENDSTFRLVAPKMDTTRTGCEPGERIVSLQSYNLNHHFVRSLKGLAVIREIGFDWPSRKEATFKLVKGLADEQCFSLELAFYPGYFVVSQDGKLEVLTFDDTLAYRKGATFRLVPGLASVSWVSFELYDHPGVFMRHQEASLYFQSSKDAEFSDSATFRLSPPLWTGSKPPAQSAPPPP